MKPPVFSLPRNGHEPNLWGPLATTVVGLCFSLCGTVAFVVGFVWLRYQPVWVAGVLLFALSLVAICSGMLSYKAQVDRFRHKTQNQHYATPYGQLHAEDEEAGPPCGHSRQVVPVKPGRLAPLKAPPSTIVLEDTAGWNGAAPQSQNLHACGVAVHI
ncbi:hypothetical protein HPB50_004255 [Hyalomma asiaticum]|uniref:Uncharacterized protein n=1 Tax=Hyalomma asiaticum TaxID=266040 RepID=A0ACB7TEY6_HYAAI|nr:hypothetical protein HPB50_004255 [Hyalomma asiaticum]